MKQYSSYIDSGIQWLNEIPAHWKILPGRALFTENKEKNDGGEHQVLSLSYGSIIIKKNVNEGLIPENYSSYQYIRPGYIIVRCTDLQNDKVSLRTSISEYEGIITGAYLGLIPKPICRSKFIHYLLRAWDCSKELYRYGSGLRQSLSWNDFKYLLLPIPTPEEQDAIVAYLDAATAKIDEAIAQQQRMIDLLNERKKIIISKAVTIGFGGECETKDSGVSWIGSINREWNLYKLKFLLSEHLMYGANESAESENESYPRYIRITDIDEDSNLKPDTFVSLSPTKAAPYLLKKGDILFARSGATAGKTFLFKEDTQACFAGYLIKASLGDRLLPEYLSYYTSSGIYDNWKNSIFIQATIPNIGAEKYGMLQIPLPSVDEQRMIIDYLDKEVGKLMTAIGDFKRKISLLQERKQIIINDVVTGKVKVV